jgi:hypothetical protein
MEEGRRAMSLSVDRAVGLSIIVGGASKTVDRLKHNFSSLIATFSRWPGANLGAAVPHNDVLGEP